MTLQKSSEKSQSILFRALKALPASDKPKIIAVVILQATLGFLDYRYAKNLHFFESKRSFNLH